MTEKEKKEMETTEKKAIERSGAESTREGVLYVPDVDIVETDEAITLWVDVPGARRDQVDIDINENVLTLTARVEPPAWERPLYREYDVGGFERRFTLGEKVDQEKISAKLEDGVMILTVPKAAPHEPRKIAIA